MQKINTALMSYGMSGEVFHGPLLQAHAGFHISSVFHRSRTKQAVHKHAVVFSEDEIFDDPDIELVIVNTPNQLHFDHARRALLAGKHVVVEKPFTVTVAEADELIDLAAQQHRILTVFQNRRWDGDFLTVRNVVGRKLLGAIVEFEAHYDRFRNYVEPDTWKEKAGPGTGVLYNLGSHMIDQALVLFGLPESVDARLGVRRPGGTVDDFYDIRMQYAGFLVVLKSSYLVREAGPRYIIHGIDGSFVKYGLDRQEQDLKDKKTPGSIGWGADDSSHWGKLHTGSYNGPVETTPGNYLAFYDALYASIRNNAAPPVSGSEARDVIRVIEACIASNGSGCIARLS